MKIISIETATDICGAAYIRDGQCIDIVEESTPRKHAEKLPLFTGELLSRNHLDLKEMDGIALSHGPGSFTGLRIGLSYAKGLAYGHGLPLIPVPTLAALGKRVPSDFQKKNLLLFSHGRMVFYQQLKEEIDSDRPVSLEWDEIPFEKTGEWIHYGCQDLLRASGRVMREAVPSAEWIGLLAEQNYQSWLVEDSKQLVPDYISPFKVQMKK